jgi:hypothetical protein
MMSSYRNTNGNEGYLLAIAYVDREEDIRLNRAKRESAYKSFNDGGVGRTNEKDGRKVQSSKYMDCFCGIFLFMWRYIEGYFIKYYVNKQKYNHCELGFPLEEDNTKCMAYGVFRECGVFSKERTFANSAYKWIYLKINGTQKRKLIKFCDAQIGKPFDYSGVKWSIIWPNKYKSKVYKDRDRWWCAPFIVAALQQIGMLTSYNPDCLDVDDIINIVKESDKVITSLSPYQFELMKTALGESKTSSPSFSSVLTSSPYPPSHYHCLSPQKIKQ